MRFVFNEYALGRLAQRGVSREIVESVVREPEQIIPGNEGGRTVYQSRVTIPGKPFLLRVVVDARKEPLRVVTLYLTNQVSRYWIETEEEEER